LRVGGELLVGDPARSHLVILGDQPVELGGDPLLVQTGVGQVEIKATLAVADRAAGHVAGYHGAQQVHAGMHAHQPVAPLPIDLDLDLHAGLGQIGALGGDVHHLVLARALARVDDPRLAAGPAQQADVAGLPAASGIEHRPVELNAVGPRGQNGCFAAPAIGVVAKDQLHGPLPQSSQSGAGRPLSRRNAALNSLL
jgi:hypothetical protein